MFVNARAIIERDTPSGTEIVIQTRNKPHEGGKSLELPGGRVEEFESLIDALKREVREEIGLTITHIEGIVTKVNAQTQDTEVECLQPFAVYQTTQGPVDSMGVYFRCRGEGSLLEVGDEILSPQWVPIDQIAQWLGQEVGQLASFSALVVSDIQASARWYCEALGFTSVFTQLPHSPRRLHKCKKDS